MQTGACVSTPNPNSQLGTAEGGERIVLLVTRSSVALLGSWALGVDVSSGVVCGASRAPADRVTCHKSLSLRRNDPDASRARRHADGCTGWRNPTATAASDADAATLTAVATAAAPPPVFRTEANFVRVDVYPLKDGKPLQGLKLEDFEVLEDGVAQKIESFEHVVIRSAGPQETRREPSSQRESLQEATNPRNRVFVIFLDTTHVSVNGSHAIKEPLIQLIDRILGPDDLVGVMTPAMAASQVVLARKTQVIEDSLRTNWPWGRRFSLMNDEREEAYEICYPLTDGEAKAGRRRSVLAEQMIRRKRERATLEALEDLVRYLHAIREERKAILAVSEGWLLYREDRNMMTLRKDGEYQEPIPSTDPIVVGPRGQPVTKDPRNISERSLSKNECDTDRLRLSTMDNDQFFRDIMDQANRGNSTFYPIDPRGLAVFDTPIGPTEEYLPPHMDAVSLKTRQEALRTLASNTDGIAVMDSNDLNAGLKRISDDLTSVLSPWLLLHERETRRQVSQPESARQAARRPGARQERISGGKTRGGHGREKGGGAAGVLRTRIGHKRRTRNARPHPARRAIPDQRSRLAARAAAARSGWLAKPILNQATAPT